MDAGWTEDEMSGEEDAERTDDEMSGAISLSCGPFRPKLSVALAPGRILWSDRT